MWISNSLGATDVGHFLGRKRVIFWARLFQRNPTGAMHRLLLPRKADNHLQQIIGPWNSSRGSALKHWTYTEGWRLLQVTLAFQTLLYFTNDIYSSLISLMWRQCFKCSWYTSDHASSTDAWCVFPRGISDKHQRLNGHGDVWGGCQAAHHSIGFLSLQSKGC